MKKCKEQAERSASELGKFGSAEELLAAYNALEREFTRRSQQLKALLAEKQCSSAQADTAALQDGARCAAPKADADAEALREECCDTDVCVCTRQADEERQGEADIAAEAAATAEAAAAAEEAAAAEAAEAGAEKATAAEAVAAEAAATAVADEAAACGSPETAGVERAITDRQLVEYILADAGRFAEALSAAPQIMDACIARYKLGLLGVGAVAPPSGMAVIVPVKKPRTLSEAKRLADEMLG